MNQILAKSFRIPITIWSDIFARTGWIGLLFGLFAVHMATDFTISLARHQPLFTTTFEWVAKGLANSVGFIELRPGYLTQDDHALSSLKEQLQPFDIILVAAPFKGTSFFTPGRYTHMAIWLGTSDDWKAADWDKNERYKPLFKAVSQGQSLLQADRDGVVQTPLSNILNADEIAVYRPSKLTSPQFHFDRIMQNMGKAYDYNLDGFDHNRVICTELVSGIFPGIRVQKSTRLWRSFILPDDLLRGLERSTNWQRWFHEGPQSQ
ncbi:YiiX/YebB-like N1pC/P60 family cysteine hydrolase [Cohaesibacter celericrescens]|uniref:YiiX/YebB-like N1pC/P60 family cysteine hydrolase n=1 Tax=Cohaesibacter celericrescens TaxID=2067669 RepID=UPI003566065D